MAIKQGRVREIPGLAALMTAHRQAMDALAARPLIEKEKRRLRSEAEAAVRTKVAALVEAARAQVRRSFDQEEGALRRAARADDLSDADLRRAAALAARAQGLAAQVDRMADPATVRRVFDEAVLMADAEAIRTVGVAVQARLRQLSEGDKAKTVSAVRDAALRFDQEFGAWRKANPSAVERLAEIERQRGQASILFEASARFALDLHGIQPAAPQPKPVPDAEVA
jgi:hypothetical protein